MATKPGERKQQILETLAKMLETPTQEKLRQHHLLQNLMSAKPRFIATLQARHKCSKG